MNNIISQTEILNQSDVFFKESGKNKRVGNWWLVGSALAFILLMDTNDFILTTSFLQCSNKLKNLNSVFKDFKEDLMQIPKKMKSLISIFKVNIQRLRVDLSKGLSKSSLFFFGQKITTQPCTIKLSMPIKILDLKMAIKKHEL